MTMLLNAAFLFVTFANLSTLLVRVRSLVLYVKTCQCWVGLLVCWYTTSLTLPYFLLSNELCSHFVPL